MPASSQIVRTPPPDSMAIALSLSANRPLSAAAARFVVIPPPGTSLPPALQPIAPAVSPDGSRLVFHVIRGGEPKKTVTTGTFDQQHQEVKRLRCKRDRGASVLKETLRRIE